MDEFKSFIFEKKPAKNDSFLWWITIGLSIIGISATILEVMNIWLSIPTLIIPFIIFIYLRFKDVKFGEQETLNGYFSAEIIINENEVKIDSTSIPLEKISSLAITYNNIHGTKKYSAYTGYSLQNGETNILIINLLDNTTIQYNFKLDSIGHANKLLKLTEHLKRKVQIKNNWEID